MFKLQNNERFTKDPNWKFFSSGYCSCSTLVRISYADKVLKVTVFLMYVSILLHGEAADVASVTYL